MHKHCIVAEGKQIILFYSILFYSIQESLLLFLFHGTEFRAVFSSAEWFGMKWMSFASIFVPQYEIPSIFLGMVRNGIPRVLRSAEQLEFRRNKPIVPPFPSSAE